MMGNDMVIFNGGEGGFRITCVDVWSEPLESVLSGAVDLQHSLVIWAVFDA
jgi:hypothetical protein